MGDTNNSGQNRLWVVQSYPSLLLPGAHHPMICSRQRKPLLMYKNFPQTTEESVPSRQNSILRLNFIFPALLLVLACPGVSFELDAGDFFGSFWVSGKVFSVVSIKSPALQAGLWRVFLGRAPYVPESCKNISGIWEEAEVHNWNYQLAIPAELKFPSPLIASAYPVCVSPGTSSIAEILPKLGGKNFGFPTR